MQKILLFTLWMSMTCIAHGQVTNGLVTKYSFNSATANDEIGTNHLTLQNGATMGADRFGNNDYAASLDGTDDYMRTNSPFFYPGQSYSFSLWFKSDNAAKSAQTLFNTDPHNLLSVGYNWYGDGSFDSGISNGSGWSICSTAPNGLDTSFNLNGVTVTDWTHFVMTYDGATWNYYIDNNLTNVCSSGTPANTVSDLLFGAISVGPQSYFSGLLDDIRIYNRAITPVEVDSLFNEADPMAVGIQELDFFNNTVSVYPNPTKGLIYLSDPYDVVLTDVTGKIVFQKQNSNRIDIADQPSGMYFVLIYNNKGALIQRNKIVKN